MTSYLKDMVRWCHRGMKGLSVLRRCTDLARVKEEDKMENQLIQDYLKMAIKLEYVCILIAVT